MNRLLAWLVLLVALLTSGWASASWSVSSTTTWLTASEASQSAAGTTDLRVRPTLELVVSAHRANHDATNSEYRVGHGAECLGFDESPAARGIGATGKLGEAALKALGGESQVAFRTSVGRRVVDQLVNGIAHESKVGYASLTKGIAGQIAKDAELMASGEIRGATWHFFRSSVTGKIGPSAPLRQALGDAGIGIVMH